MPDDNASRPEVRIEPYRPEFKEHFQRLNYEWLEKYFEVEPFDRIVLNDPEAKIIDNGGFVLFATIDDEVVGTCALLKHTEHKYELAKMGVTESAQGRGVGRKLIEAAMATTRRAGADTLVLATSELLEAANHLYRKMGFEVASREAIGPLPYKRHTIVMKMDL